MPIIDVIIDRIDHFKPISDIAGKVIALLDDPDSGAADLSAIIRHEPALTANVLKLANSAYFGLPGKIEDTRQAIVYLGMNQVVDLVLMISCSEHLNGSHDGYRLSNGELWKSAVSAAIMASDIAEIIRVKTSSLVFTGALLRDIGKVVISQYVKAASEQILDLVRNQTMTFLTAERQVLGVDHAQVGAALAKNWHFPLPLQCIISHHHMPLAANACNMEASIVHLADTMCRNMQIGLGVDDPSYPEDDRVAISLGLQTSDLKAVADGFSLKMERVNTLFEIG